MSTPAGQAAVPAAVRSQDVGAGIPAPAGLPSDEARRRLARCGPNTIPEERPRRWRVLLGKFWAPVPWMLEAAVVLELVLHNRVEAVIIAALLAFNALLSFIQEQRAQGALALLRRHLTVQARVRRDGRWQWLPAADLVPGDAVHLRLGDLIPADVVLADGQLLVDQAALTGESMPVELAPGGTAYAGAVVERGEATGTVQATGTRTTFGRVAELVRTAGASSHLERAIFGLVRYLVGLDLVLILAVLGDAALRGIPLRQVLPFALVLLIASVPVALPASAAVATALGAGELARRGVLVTHLAAVEEAAGMDVLCTDKTGTLTRGQVELTAVRPAAPWTTDDLVELAALACDEATQDPLDLAILHRLQPVLSPAVRLERLEFTPFDPATKRAEALALRDGRRWRVAKGAPATLLALAERPDPAVAADAETLAAAGLRVLAVAAGPDPTLQIVGLLGFQDAPRPESAALIHQLQHLGVRPLMVTGDDVATARAIAGQVGIGERTCPREELLSGDPARLLACDVFAGVFPQDKFTLVQTLQRAGHVVGMTGDGVNDAPALRQAEVGIAMANATDVAKASASLVLTAPGLTNVIAAVDDSRRIYRRMLAYSLNMTVKKLELPLLLTLGLVLGGVFVTSPRLMVLLLFTNDIVTLTIATDRVAPSPSPERWRVRPLFTGALRLALPLLLLSGGVYWAGPGWLGLDLAATQTLVFVWLVASGQATLYVVRAQGSLWRPRPGTWVLAATVADLAVVALLATRGWLMAPIPAALVAGVLGMALFFLVAATLVSRLLVEREPAPRTRANARKSG